MIHDPARSPLLTFALATVLVLSGCLAGLSPGASGGASGPPADDGPSLDDGDDVVRDAEGVQEVPDDVERVVALEWVYAENLLALGVQPVGVAGVDGYRNYVDVPVNLSEDVTDVGTRQEPSIETIASLNPDLIIGVTFRHAEIRDRLEDVAPTLLFDPYPAEDGPRPLDEMETTFVEMGEALDREDRAHQVLGQTHDHLNRQRAEVRAAGAAGQEVLLAQTYVSEGSPTMRLFTNNSMAVQALDEIGLRNAWTEPFAPYGFDTVGLEALAPVDEATFLYTAHAEDDPFRDGGEWAGNDAWGNLTFVQEDRVHHLPGDTWVFGGPLGIQEFTERVTDRLAR